MYTHLVKGGTVGLTITRRLLRNITGIPGYVIDLILGGLWTNEDYRNSYTPYLDNVRTSPWRGAFGYIGDIIGIVVGAISGAIIGAALYFPDRAILLFSQAYRAIRDDLNTFAEMVGTHSFFKALLSFQLPSNYIQKCWNISVGITAVSIGLLLYGILRLIEIALPIGNFLSNTFWKLGGLIGGVVGAIISLAAFPVLHLSNKMLDLYDRFREGVRNVVAFFYAKTNQKLYVQNDGPCLPNFIHSDEFRQKVTEFKDKNTTTILFGTLNPSQPGDAKVINENVLECPITQSEFVDPVIDRHGHTFEKAAILGWLHNNATCPLGRELLNPKDLAPNLAVKSIVESKALNRR